MGQETFKKTNESLKSIIAGLNPGPKDNILAIAGSGDQAFAMLEKGAKVSVVDSCPHQIEYIKKRIDNLSDGDIESFLSISKTDSYYFKHRDFYFENISANTIKSNLANFNIFCRKSIFSLNGELKNFNKFYLSNAPDHNSSSFNFNTLKSLSKKLNQNSLVLFCNKRGFDPSKINFEDLSFEERLSEEANKYRFESFGKWNYFVYRVI